jgi:hypothetical protein
MVGERRGISGYPLRMRLLRVLLLLMPVLCSGPGLCSAQATAGGNGPGGVIAGTVTDASGALVTGATVVLSTAGSSTGHSAITGDDGAFAFRDVAAGGFQLTLTAKGLEPGTATGTLQLGERQELPPIVLRVADQSMDVEVTFTREELGVAEVQAEEKQRILGVIPNFSVAYDWNAPPMTTRQKYDVAFKETVDPVSIALNAGIAGYELAAQDYYYPHQTDQGWQLGGAGYFKRFGANVATGAIGTFIGGALLPEVFHQDPRYFWKGSGTVRQRVLYSLSTVLICRNDRNGKWMFNYSNVIGDFSAGAISELYYPAPSRQGVGLTFENGLIALGSGAIGNLIQEFVIHRLTPNLPRATPAPVVRP